ncbi:type II secretion system protein [Neobacillus sp.]|uniref:type IV pilus modification PilV family protein n=1 Tax=Neobacillus sp. TaxID=2675273 RepID=UPI002897A9AB|nr:type II secretion system protein [Neobacillus sp.]
MELLKNEKGLTLIEVLLSIVILSMILLSIMSMFPQMGFVNKQNEDKAQAINMAKEILVNWQESNEVKTFIEKPDHITGFTPEFVNEKVNYTHFAYDKYPDYYYFGTTKDHYDVRIKIKKSPIKSSKVSHVHQIVVQLINKRGNIIAETYGYVTR